MNQLLNDRNWWRSAGKKWVKHRYWHTIGERNWVFGVKQNEKVVLELESFAAVAIQYHTKVVGSKSWYDGDWVYWGTRRGFHPMTGTREATLLKRQHGRCTICRGVFDLYDRIEHCCTFSQGQKAVLTYMTTCNCYIVAVTMPSQAGM